MHTNRNPFGSLSSGQDQCASVDGLPPGAGIRFTALMQRSWGARRSVNPGLLVLSMLEDDARRRLLEEWRNAGAGSSSSFFAAGADSLLDFIAAQLPDDAPERAICRLEQLTLRAHDGASTFKPPDPVLFGPERMLRRGLHAGLVIFHGEPNPLISALLPRARNPALSGRATALLVAPGSEPVCRIASQPERELWMRLSGPAVAAVLIEEGASREQIESMLYVGALEYS